MRTAVGIAKHELLVHVVVDARRAMSEALRTVVVLLLLRLLMVVVQILRGAKVDTIVVVDRVRRRCSRRITRASWGVKVRVVERRM